MGSTENDKDLKTHRNIYSDRRIRKGTKPISNVLSLKPWLLTYSKRNILDIKRKVLLKFFQINRF